MKNILFIILILGFQACVDLFPKNQKLLKEYKLQNGNTIEVYYVNLGATSNNIIQIRKKVNQKDFLVTIIKGFDDTYLINLNQINDSALKITFTDTSSYWKGKSRDFDIHLNDSATIKD